MAIVSEDTRKFVHTHGEDVASGGIVVGNHGHGGGHGDHGEGQTFGPRIGFTHTFREPGLHKIWAECNDHADKRPYEIVFVDPGEAPPDESRLARRQLKLRSSRSQKGAEPRLRVYVVSER